MLSDEARAYVRALIEVDEGENAPSDEVLAELERFLS